MKKTILNLVLITLLVTSISSCDDQLDINRDPDSQSPDGVALATELPAGILGVIGSNGAYGALVGGFWSQYWTQSNAANQYKTLDDYSILNSSSIISGYYTTAYDALADIRNVKRIAEEKENWNYYLIATVMETYSSEIMADFFDQIPYEEANNPSILQPKFNTGPEVYDLLIADIDDALSKNLDDSMGEIPGNDDVIFQGDMDSWIAFANTLKLKIYLRQQNARPDVAQTGITNLLSSATFLDKDAGFNQFEDAPDKSNPLYESNERQLNVATNLRASTTLYSYLNTNSDPRLPLYYEAGDPLNQGDFNSTTSPGDISVVNLKPTTPVYLMSREESLFIQAEAQLEYGSPATAETKYNAAVTENFTKKGLDASTFIASGGAYAYPNSGSDDDQLKAIITQKWVSGFPGNGFESFFDTNRTDIPATSSVPQSSTSYVPGELTYSVNGTTGGDFPMRLLIPQDVTSRNPNAPTLLDITAPVWWAE